MSAANSTNVTGTVGSILRESRESQGITIEEAARVTRIGKNYLVALEKDRFELLPSTSYVKGFLRAYAGFLGLSADEMVALFEKSLSPPMRPSETETEIPEVAPRPRGTRRGRWFISFILLALVIGAAYLYEHFGFVKEKPAPQVYSPPAIQPTPAPVLPARTSAQKPPVRVEEPVQTEKPLPPAAKPTAQAAGIVLKLKVNQDCWLNITIDGTISQQYNLKTGDVIEWKGEKAFALDLGNPGGVEAEFNGKVLKPLGERGKPVHVTLKAPGAP